MSGSSPGSHQDYMRRFVLHRALAYLASYVLTWMWFIIAGILVTAGKGEDIPLALLYVQAVMTPLQGAFNFLIYMLPKASRARRDAGGSISRYHAFAKALRTSLVGHSAGAPGGGGAAGRPARLARGVRAESPPQSPGAGGGADDAAAE